MKRPEPKSRFAHGGLYAEDIVDWHNRTAEWHDGQARAVGVPKIRNDHRQWAAWHRDMAKQVGTLADPTPADCRI